MVSFYSTSLLISDKEVNIIDEDGNIVTLSLGEEGEIMIRNPLTL